MGKVPDALDLALGGSGPSHLTSVEDFIHDFINECVPAAPTHSNLQENARLDPPLEDGTRQNVTTGSPADVVANISNAPAWMRKKQILDYL